MLSATAVWWITSTIEQREKTWKLARSKFCLRPSLAVLEPWKKKYHDAKTIGGKFGKPTFFNVYLQSQVEGNTCYYPKLLEGLRSSRYGRKSIPVEEKRVYRWYREKASIGFRHGQNRSNRISETRTASLPPAGMGRQPRCFFDTRIYG